MEIIKPAFSNRNVPICFSSNDKYIPMLAVSIQSIIENSRDENNYDIVILITNVSDENKVKIYSLVSNHKNFSIRFVNVGSSVYGYDFYIDSTLSSTKYSDEIYYRVLVPALMQNYKNVIFLDADVVVLDDIANLLNYDCSNALIGGIRDYEGIANCYNNNYEQTKYRINEVGVKNFENYFISGVLIINTVKFNEKFTQKQLLEMAVSKNWKQYDQDLLNFICKENVVILDAKWNFVEDIYGIFQSMPSHLFEEYVASEKAPKIIHYSGSRKPWIKTDSKFNVYFWKYAKNTPFYQELNALLVND